ncbi:hypothetical protein TNCV_3182291 [Trichonephila clavipes]|uniref:Uncharacterized protein n=1 Tax=Trichonephila clavipes TaxID=2585209 RepID=A0A8X6SCG6_TRICX|nr:hypothetical protein TNCV_3182291 [Trichonephila clavipes]
MWLDVLATAAKGLRGTIGPDFNFVDDNVHPQITSAIKTLLESEKIYRMNWCHIVGLKEAGYLNRRIGKQWVTEVIVYRRGGSGRPRNTNACNDCAIMRADTSFPKTSLVYGSTPYTIFKITGGMKGNHLKMIGQRRYKELMTIKTPTTDPSLDFCRPRTSWSVTFWMRVIFSDESRFSLNADDQRRRM